MRLNALFLVVSLFIAHGAVEPSAARACSCIPEAIWRSDPSDGASDVPVNQALVVEGLLLPESIALEDADGAPVEFDLEHAPTPGCKGTWAEIKPRKLLAPMTAYRIRVAPSGPVTATPDAPTVAFRTGTRVLEERDLLPPKGRASVVEGLPQSGASCGPTIVMACVALEDYTDVEIIARRDGEIIMRWLFGDDFSGYADFGLSVVPDCIELRRRAATGQRSAPLTLCGDERHLRSYMTGDALDTCGAGLLDMPEPAEEDEDDSSEDQDVSQPEANGVSKAARSGDGCSAGRGARAPGSATALFLLIVLASWRSLRKWPDPGRETRATH